MSGEYTWPRNFLSEKPGSRFENKMGGARSDNWNQSFDFTFDKISPVGLEGLEGWKVGRLKGLEGRDGWKGWMGWKGWKVGRAAKHCGNS